jgi:hypothetical protein
VYEAPAVRVLVARESLNEPAPPAVLENDFERGVKLILRK